ncbi:MAG: glycosyltransferase family 2 protein [Parcubacteria group bacterium]|nr:MAG: glycosyltransferase family 2 protein [Parcubacteria group bacterium]
MNIFVIIPAWNEGERIDLVLKSLIAFDYRVVVVDDGSTDQTATVVSRYPVTLLRHKINRDQGAALQTGNEYALSRGADIIVHFDADGQFLAQEIKDIIAPLINDDYDIVFGSRFLGKESRMPWFKKNLYFPLARLFNRLVLGVKFSDPQNGFRAMTRRTAELITIEQDHKAHCSEIAAKAVALKLKTKEVPITVIYHHFGQGFGGGLKIVRDLLLSKIIK